MSDTEPKAQATAVKLKFLEAMPPPDKFLKNFIIARGESAMDWFGKLQGQINYRLQSFLNNETDAIKNPKLVRRYTELANQSAFTSDTPQDYLGLELTVDETTKGFYLLNVDLLLGCSSSGSLITINVTKNDQPVFPVPPSLKISSNDQKLPVHLGRTIWLDAGKNTVKVAISRSSPMIGSTTVTGYFASLDLFKTG